MKKIVALILIVVTLLTGCGNYQVVDFQYSFNYAVLKLQNGEVIEGKVESWRDYEDGEQLQVKINGVLYLTNSYNCTLMYKP